MNLNQRLRASAINDLQRFCPSAHYWLREHSPQADLELAHIVLANPGSLRPTLREWDAAQAISSLAQFEIRSRDIWSRLNPVRDSGALPAEPDQAAEQERFDGEREIAGRYEVFRSSAMAYARAIDDQQMIEGYAALRPIDTAAGLAEDSETTSEATMSPAERRERLDITRERGARRRIIESWSDIEKEYGPGADAHQVLRVLKRDKDADQPVLKTVQNLLSILRAEGLIP